MNKSLVTSAWVVVNSTRPRVLKLVQEKNRELPRTLVALGLVTVLFLICCYLVNWLPMGDWVLAYRPACLRLIAGESPYAAEPGEIGFFNPVWTLLPLLPIALLPPVLDKIVLAFFTILVSGYVALRMGASPLGAVLILLSFPVICGLGYGQIGWLVILGLVLPPRWGLLLVMMKPQAGIGVALYWLWEAWHDGGIKNLVYVSLPVAIGTVLTAAVFLADPGLGILAQWSSISVFPYLVPVGVALMAVAIARQNMVFAIPAAQCLTPYIQEHSLTGVLLAAARSTKLVAALSLLSWLFIFLGD